MANNNCKFYKVVRQVSYDSGVTWVNIGETQKGDLYEYDSAECGAVTQYRWVDVTGAYTCEGTTKYQKTKKQYSTDGTTWQDVSPAEYGKGQVLEYMSVDCGYDPTLADEYMGFIPRTAGNFKFISHIHRSQSGNEVVNTVYYSLDGGINWTLLPDDTYTPTVQAGQKILWKGNFTSNFRYGIADGTLNTFMSNCEFDVEGNVMSLVYSDSFQGKTSLEGTYAVLNSLFGGTGGLRSAENLILPATTLGELCYAGMFGGCTGMTAAPSLPATTLAPSCYENMFFNCTSLTTAPALPATNLSGAKDCYNYMFNGCSSLIAAPELPATTLSIWCYHNMFSDCTSLTTVPTLPATTLAERCYGYMFSGCTSLTTVPSNMLPATNLSGAENCYMGMFEDCTSLTAAPELPATSLEYYCYQYMFRRCTSLNYIKCMATRIKHSSCTEDWVRRVASSGTFVKNSSMSSWTTGVNGIPNNWTVQNA